MQNLTDHHFEGTFVLSQERSAKAICTSTIVVKLDFSLPVSNPFGPLAHCNETPMRQNLGNASSARNSKKYPVLSPLDDEHTMKKHREDLIIHVSEADSESDDSQMAISACPKSPEPTTCTSDTSSESKSVVYTTTDLELQTDTCEENSEELTAALLKHAILAATLVANVTPDG